MSNTQALRFSALRPQYLWFFILSYAMIYSISNWFDSKLVVVFGFTIPPGTLLYPFTFLLSDIITEVYGFKYARQAIWSALLFNTLFIAFGQLVAILPPANIASSSHFDEFLAINSRIIASSFSAYLISEPINSFLLSKLKIVFNGQYIGLRFVASTFIASFIDCNLFFIFAFAGIIEPATLFKMILTSWSIKVIIEFLGLPFSIRLAKWLKRKEQIDMYDNSTVFNLLKFDTDYDHRDNRYQEKIG